MSSIPTGETTLIAKVFYGDAYSYVMHFMTLSPQFNMAYAYWKIEQLFMYNSECYIFEEKKLCSVNEYHKCCGKSEASDILNEKSWILQQKNLGILAKDDVLYLEKGLKVAFCMDVSFTESLTNCSYCML